MRRERVRAWTALRRARLRWWLVYGPVRSGTTLAADLVAAHTRWVVSDWGLHAALTEPLRKPPDRYDVARPHRALLAEVLAACDTGKNGILDLVYKQANLRQPEYDALVRVLGVPERTIFCLRDPAGFMASAVRKFPDAGMDNLQSSNYVGTIDEWSRIGGDVFLYHPKVTGDDYAQFLRPLQLSDSARASVRYSGSAAPELTTEQMWQRFHELAGQARNVVPPSTD
jgi:hypothetical protein